MQFLIQWLVILCASAIAIAAESGDFASRCADRAAIERVYHAHRLGVKPPFEQAMPRETIERIVREEIRKETVLRKLYGVEITPPILAGEVERINATTRAPEILAEIKQALGGDGARFATAMARPILVEGELRRRFDNDDKLHVAQRREAEKAREALLAKIPVKDMRDVTWQLSPRPRSEAPVVTGSTEPSQANAKSGSYTIEATAQLSQSLTPNRVVPGKDKSFFEDLDLELQKVLRVQLRQPGSVSAVIETPAGFLVFVAKEKTAETLAVASLTIPKRSYDEWLAQQPE